MKVSAIVGALYGLLATVEGTLYRWPSPYDEIEDILSLQSGYLARNFVAGVTPCSQGGNVKGRQNAAEWIRTAFHDMITHNQRAGTGGLDGSIWFETTRPENNARAFNNTFNFFNYLYSTRASAADLLAMSVVVSHSGCGGTTKIPFRYGRADAPAAGPYGVPETHTPLDTTTQRFLDAGVSREEMILLVACGHTLGGVHSVDFPELSPGSSDPFNDTVTHFDSTPHAFDNAIATEFVKGTTRNPLVIAANDTQNSDKRIFNSDRGKVMQTMARKASTFEQRCSQVFSKMIDTVPRNVRLSSPIEPIDIKPYITDLTTEGARAGRDPNDLSAHITYADRRGWGSVKVATTQAGPTQGLYGETFTWFEFTTTISPSSGISKFYIHLTVPSKKRTTLHTNWLLGYPVDDALLYQRAASCVSRTSVNGGRPMTATVAVLKSRASAPLTMDVVRIQTRSGTLVRSLTTETLPFAKNGEERDGYVFLRRPSL
ncbi:unnamed protein product [Parascedosporium putredinis]|uniref:Peroxidase n=1 Tax=Parascedosporium putredinis TaxID=1442378 RepID=A0A9P1MCJ4_9PEZI|nr:unnamed protein product [Parascedosporium putredinis]CAI7996699.1 unnamed protein product [Parascedosporium putredinis]